MEDEHDLHRLVDDGCPHVYENEDEDNEVNPLNGFEQPLGEVTTFNTSFATGGLLSGPTGAPRMDLAYYRRQSRWFRIKTTVRNYRKLVWAAITNDEEYFDDNFR